VQLVSVRGNDCMRIYMTTTNSSDNTLEQYLLKVRSVFDLKCRYKTIKSSVRYLLRLNVSMKFLNLKMCNGNLNYFILPYILL